MKTVKILVLLLLAGFTYKVNAQSSGIPGGTILMGGSMGFSSSTSSQTIKINGAGDSTVNGSQFQFSLSPKMGYFFFNNFCGGMVIDYATSSRKTKGQNGAKDQVESESQLLAGPFVRYYFFPSNRVGFFGEVSLGLGAGATANGTTTANVSQFALGIGPGLTFFANDIVAIEALLKYNMLNNSSSYTTSGSGTGGANSVETSTAIHKVDFGVGFQFYFNRVIGGAPGAPGTGIQ